MYQLGKLQCTIYTNVALYIFNVVIITTTGKSVHIGQVVEGVSLDLQSIKQLFVNHKFYLHIYCISAPLFNNCFKHFS